MEMIQKSDRYLETSLIINFYNFIVRDDSN